MKYVRGKAVSEEGVGKGGSPCLDYSVVRGVLRQAVLTEAPADHVAVRAEVGALRAHPPR